MKILILYNRIPFPLNDGGNLAVHHVAQGLQALGHTVDIAFLNTLKHYHPPGSIQSWYSNIYSVDIDTTIEPIGMIAGLFQSTPYNINRFNSSAMSALLRQILSNETYDIIQVEGAYMGLYVPLIKRLTQSPVVLRSHNIEHQIWQRLAKGEKHPIKRWYLSSLFPKIKRFELETAPLYRHILAISDSDAHVYHKMTPQTPVTTIAAGMLFTNETPIFTPTPTAQVCFIGSMEWMPNIEGLDWFFERVWPLVRAFEPQALCHLAGKGMAAVEHKWKSIPGVTLHGQVPDASDFILKHGIFIVPLLSGGGMRLKMVEGMSLSRPIVSTTIGAEGIAYERNVDVYIADQPEAFANAILDLYHHPDKAQLMAQKAYQKAKKLYDWNVLVKRFEEVYTTLL